MSLALARVLVFSSGAAVLVIETLATRLVAPYVGLTLESYSAAIGVALLGIAAGAHTGGRLADVLPPRRVAAVATAAGALMILAIRPIVHVLGPDLRPGPVSALTLVVLSTLAPVTALSVVPVAVTRARLASVEGSGRVLGSFSALGTIGALAGTFLTGFVFVATLPTGTILLGTAALLLILAIVAASWGSRRSGAGVAALALPLTAFAGLVDGPCDIETRYHCARIEVDAARAGGRALWLDDLQHAYVDLDDPTYLGFAYTRRFAELIDARFPSGSAIRGVHLGGGGFSMPRYLAATRPGSTATVLEIDRAVVALGRERLGVGSIPETRTIIGDARTSLRGLAPASADLVIGDAFGGRSVPWHLATRESVSAIARVLAPGGLYVLNVIDYHPNAFLRAEVATVRAVFRDVALVARRDALSAGGGGNFVVVATDGAMPWERLEPGDGWSLMRGADLDAVVGGARVLTDAFAPVDQLLTPYPA